MIIVAFERITIDPEICHGKPCIRGLRYPVENILELLSSGLSITHKSKKANKINSVVIWQHH